MSADDVYDWDNADELNVLSCWTATGWNVILGGCWFIETVENSRIGGGLMSCGCCVVLLWPFRSFILFLILSRDELDDELPV